MSDAFRFDSEYEEPVNPDLVLGRDGESVEVCVEKVIKLLEENEIIQSNERNPIELFVPAHRLEAVTAEANTLPRINIDVLSLHGFVCLSVWQCFLIDCAAANAV